MNPPKLQVPEISTHSFDKKYFSYYRSASLHTHKDRLPYKKLLPILLGVLAVPVLFWYAFSVLTVDEDVLNVDRDFAGNQSGTMSTTFGFGQNRVVSSADYYASRIPRIEGLLHTAPIYDELNQPVITPKPAACVFFHERFGDCKCWSQQATPLPVTSEFCHNAVVSGWFDDTKLPPEFVENDNFRHNETTPISGPSRPRSVLISDSTP